MLNDVNVTDVVEVVVVVNLVVVIVVVIVDVGVVAKVIVDLVVDADKVEDDADVDVEVVANVRVEVVVYVLVDVVVDVAVLSVVVGHYTTPGRLRSGRTSKREAAKAKGCGEHQLFDLRSHRQKQRSSCEAQRQTQGHPEPDGSTDYKETRAQGPSQKKQQKRLRHATPEPDNASQRTAEQTTRDLSSGPEPKEAAEAVAERNARTKQSQPKNG